MSYLYDILNSLARKRQEIKESGNKKELKEIDAVINKILSNR